MGLPQKGDIERVHCNRCLGQTNHKVIAVRRIIEPDEDSSFDWTCTYTMLECLGCSKVTMRCHYVVVDIDNIENTLFYPPPISRKIPPWWFKLPSEISDLLQESYVALQAGGKRLAIMGARTLIDMFMSSTVGDLGGFEQKLKELVKQGYLASKHRDILKAALNAGHAVVHRGHEPTTKDINHVFDIVENLLHSMVLKQDSDELEKNTPKRGKTKESEIFPKDSDF